MRKEKMTFRNESGKSITFFVDPEYMMFHHSGRVELVISPSQWRRLVAVSDSTPWYMKYGRMVSWTCPPAVFDCRFPGRK